MVSKLSRLASPARRDGGLPLQLVLTVALRALGVRLVAADAPTSKVCLMVTLRV